VWLCCLLLAALAPTEVRDAVVTVPSALEPSAEVVRIAVGRFRDSVVITGPSLRVINVPGVPVGPAGARQKVEVKLNASGLVLDGKPIKDDVIRIVNDDMVSLRGHSYRQELEVRFQLYDKKTPEMLVVHPLDIETYVVGIVSSELPADWLLAAYQAQAVAARSFAVFQKHRRLELPYHLESSVLDQVYHGAEKEHALARLAVESTRGVVLTHQRKLMPAYFHASCGGMHESAREGWGSDIGGLPGGVCGRCAEAKRSSWTGSVGQAEVERLWGKRLKEAVVNVAVEERTTSGRAKNIRIAGKKRHIIVAAPEFRRMLGGMRVFSTLIDRIERKGSQWLVHGRGSGHGVGLCQWGAQGSAAIGDDFRTILGRYYPGASIFRMY
jgi:stage II sporulation protein D